MSNASHSCMNRAALSAPSASMAPAEVRRVVGDRRRLGALRRGQRGDHPDAELRPQLEHRAGVGQRLDDLAHVVDAQAVLGDDVAQQRAGRRTSHSRAGPGSTTGTASRPRPLRPRRRPRCRRRRWAPARDIGPTSSGCEHAEPAAFDHRRAAHADVRVLGRDDDVAAAEQRGVAGEAAPRVDADQRHQAAQRPHRVERHAVEARDAGAVGVARPPAAAFGEEHHRQPQALGQLEQPVLLAWFCRPCVPASTV